MARLTLTVNSLSANPIYCQIMDQIRAAVHAGQLKPKEPLPAVRQLAQDLEINPNTVAKAYMLLEREGILRNVPRRGCFVSESAPQRVRQSAQERLGEALSRMLDETARLGMDRQQIIDALRRKLEDEPATESDSDPAGEAGT